MPKKESKAQIEAWITFAQFFDKWNKTKWLQTWRKCCSVFLSIVFHSHHQNTVLKHSKPATPLFTSVEARMSLASPPFQCFVFLLICWLVVGDWVGNNTVWWSKHKANPHTKKKWDCKRQKLKWSKSDKSCNEKREAKHRESTSRLKLRKWWQWECKVNGPKNGLLCFFESSLHLPLHLVVMTVVSGVHHCNSLSIEVDKNCSTFTSPKTSFSTFQMVQMICENAEQSKPVQSDHCVVTVSIFLENHCFFKVLFPAKLGSAWKGEVCHGLTGNHLCVDSVKKMFHDFSKRF